MKMITLFCMTAMTFYAIEISITDWKLSNISPRLLTLCYALGVAICATVSLVCAGEKIEMPKSNQWVFVILMILASFIAASAHFQAINYQSGAVTLTMFYCLLPVVASLFDAIVKKHIPDKNLMLAWAIASASLFIVAFRPLK